MATKLNPSWCKRVDHMRTKINYIHDVAHVDTIEAIEILKLIELENIAIEAENISVVLAEIKVEISCLKNGD